VFGFGNDPPQVMSGLIIGEKVRTSVGPSAGKGKPYATFNITVKESSHVVSQSTLSSGSSVGV
jgi:hypothetical protein